MLGKVDEFANEYKHGIPDGTYDVVLDKGCIDCLLCDGEGEKLFKKVSTQIVPYDLSVSNLVV